MVTSLPTSTMCLAVSQSPMIFPQLLRSSFLANFILPVLFLCFNPTPQIIPLCSISNTSLKFTRFSLSFLVLADHRNLCSDCVPETYWGIWPEEMFQHEPVRWPMDYVTWGPTWLLISPESVLFPSCSYPDCVRGEGSVPCQRKSRAIRAAVKFITWRPSPHRGTSK